MQPDVSVIIPTFNRAHMLDGAIESCKQAGNEIAVEVVVVDDGSTDHTEPVVAARGVRYIKLPQNRGRCEARMEGMRRSTGSFVKFLDSDDRLESGTLPLEVELARSSNADIVVCNWREIQVSPEGNETQLKIGEAPVFESILDDVLAGKAVPTSAALYRKNSIANLTWLSTNRFDDWDFFVHAALQAEVIKSLFLPAYQWRHHAGARATDSGMLETSIAFYQVLARMRRTLEARGQFSPERRKRYAQYLYKELRTLYRFAPDEGRRVLAEIKRLDPGFRPVDEEHSIVIRILANVFPVAWVLQSYGSLRSLADRLQPSRAGK
jgi:glycosyltransferase involved in cell wall biosynthesis